MDTVSNIPPPANKILNDFVAQIQGIHADLIIGIYITGSIPLDDYYSNKSDIDFIAILKRKLSQGDIRKLEKIHFKIERDYHKPKLNGYYLTLEGIEKQESAFPSFFEGRMNPDRPFELDKVTLFELQTSSINILGKPASELPIMVTLDEVKKQLHQNINSYWIAWIRNHSVLTLGYFILASFPRMTEWGILGVARQFYTLEMEIITSKLNAGLYYQDKLPKQFRDIMSVAVETRRVNRTEFRFSFKRANKTLECMRFLIEAFNKRFDNRRYQ